MELVELGELGELVILFYFVFCFPARAHKKKEEHGGKSVAYAVARIISATLNV